MKYIQGELFKTLNNNNVFFIKTENVNNFFKTLQITHPFILISHDGDGKITNTPKYRDADINLIPQNSPFC